MKEFIIAALVALMIQYLILQMVLKTERRSGEKQFKKKWMYTVLKIPFAFWLVLLGFLVVWPIWNLAFGDKKE